MNPDTFLEQMLLSQIESKTHEVYAQHSIDDPNLCTTLYRAATSVLMNAKSQGQIKNYHVTCNRDDLNEDGTPVIQIQIEFHKRVRKIQFNFGQDS